MCLSDNKPRNGSDEHSNTFKSLQLFTLEHKHRLLTSTHWAVEHAVMENRNFDSTQRYAMQYHHSKAVNHSTLN